MKKKDADESFITKKITEIIREKLKEYLEKIDFTINTSTKKVWVFQVKDVKTRKDILKRFGIPLELAEGCVKEIKITFHSLTGGKPIEIEISEIDIQIKTIYLSQDYAKDYKIFKKKFLEDWEKKNKEFLKTLNPDSSFLENLIVDKLIPIKIEIKDVKIRIIDTVTSEKEKEILIKIEKITSYGCNSNWEELSAADKNDHIMRNFSITKFFVNISSLSPVKKQVIDNNFSNYIIYPVNFSFRLTFPKDMNIVNLRERPKMKFEVEFDNTLVLDIKNSKLLFLINFLSYLAKVKKVEKYWIHRPEKMNEMNQNTAKEMFKYAFQVIRDEMREKKRQTFDFASIIEKLFEMERYIELYKASHKLIIAPWIHKIDCENDLNLIEDKMSLDDIILCREIAFTELITEGKSYCSSGEIGEGYKPLIHLWEYYVNDLRSKWISNKQTSSQIELTSREKRDLMILSNFDKDKVLLSYIKGEHNHPEDKMVELKVDIRCMIVTFSRRVNKGAKEIKSNFNYYYDIYNQELVKKLEDTTMVKSLRVLSEEDIISIINKENDDDSEEDIQVIPKTSLLFNKNSNYFKGTVSKDFTENSVMSNLSPLNHRTSIKAKIQENKDMKETDNLSVEYIDDFTKMKDEKKEESSRKRQNRRSSIDKNTIGKNTIKMRKGSTLFSSDQIFRKSIFSVVFGGININYTNTRNDEIELSTRISSFCLVDHNLSYITVNDHERTLNLQSNASKSETYDYVESIFDNIFNEKNLELTPESHRAALQKCLATFLLETYQVYISKQINIFSDLTHPQLSTNDFNFLVSYVTNFGFKKIKDNEHTDYETMYFRDFYKILLEKDSNIFGIHSSLLQDVTNHDSINKLMEIGLQIIQEKESSQIQRESIVIQASKIEKNENKKIFSGNEKKRLIYRDLCYSFQSISILILKKIFSTLYPYLLNEKIFQKNFKKSFGDYVQDIKKIKKERSNLVSFLEMELEKKGRSYPNYIINETTEKKKKESKQSTLENEKSQFGNLKLVVNETWAFNFSNETISELLCILPFMNSMTHQRHNIVGNIITDIKKSSLRIHENYRSIRAKWKVMQYLK